MFDLPAGAQLLARSERTEVQAFRHGSAYGLLFHPEADPAFVDLWLAEPIMAGEARAAIGSDYKQRLRADAAAHEDELLPRSAATLDALVAERLRR